MMRHVAVLATAALLLAGCTAAPEPNISPAPTATPTPTEVALPTPDIGVVGTGSLDGLPFQVTWDGEQFLLLGFEQAPEGMLQMSVAPGVVGKCTKGYGLTFGMPTLAPMPVATGEVTRDVTFLTSVSRLDSYTNDCYGWPVLSTTSIAWSMQALYPDLVVTDSGDTGGALGVPTLEGTTVVSYTVRQGDVLEEIAARFGLTADQLRWLNPRRSNQAIVYKDETLNLSPSRR